MIIFRYLSKEIYITLLAVTGILLFVVLSNQLILYLTKVAAGQLALTIVFKLLMIQVPIFLSFLLPLGLFLGILLAYGRLYVDNEMTVLAACGMGKMQLVKMTLTIAVPVLIIVMALNFFINPAIFAYKYRLQAGLGMATLIQTLTPGRFQATPDGNYIIYVGNISRNRHQLKQLFIAERKGSVNVKPNIPEQPVEWNVLTAQNGFLYVDPKNGAQFIIGINGRHYAGSPGSANYQITGFNKLGYRIQQKQQAPISKTSALSSSEIIRGVFNHDINASAELQQRLSSPLGVPLLALLAVPLSRVRPRQGKFAQLVPAILIYVIYANTVLIAEQWVHKRIVPPAIGVWWVHSLMLLLAIICVIHQYGWRRLVSKISLPWHKVRV